MPSADWTSISNGSGVFAIVADLTAPSPPSVMQISAGGQHFQNITAGTFRDSRVTGWCHQVNANNNTFTLILRSLNTTFSANPATYFQVDIDSAGATQVSYTIRAVVAGVATSIVSATTTSVNGNPVNTWQQYQFSAFNSGTDILLRVAQWNGAAFVPQIDGAGPIATFPTLNAVGRCRFGGLVSAIGLTIDDINFYSLA